MKLTEKLDRSRAALIHSVRFETPVDSDSPRDTHHALTLSPAASAGPAATRTLARGGLPVPDVGSRVGARRLNALGWNAAFLHLPYHHSRRLPWHLHGELA